ncbi:MAG: type II secretion system protein [Planctomycetota bacterium]|jgi:prepilin-type N-terminal cleavage/methylation domain-containing protein/prepilin-type processing-associated H-X9-DG protein
MDSRTHRTARERRGARAFTLVELLVVVGIIALLVTILMPSLGRAMELARRTICKTQLHTLGRAWHLFLRDNNDKLPPMQNPGPVGGPYSPDCSARFGYIIYAGKPQHNVWRGAFVNAGVLYEHKLIGDERNYVCPTIKKNNGGIWFDNLPTVPFGQPRSRGGGWWPVNRRMGTYMTYNRRRMLNYDDADLSYFHWSVKPPNRPNAHLMLFYTGMNAIPSPADFSWMADRFDSPGWAMVSHVPGINVLFFDGHVTYWEDPTWDDVKGTGEVLYDNGLPTSWSDPNSNWYHDDIWMIIDGYHQPPVGQGV